MSRRLRVPLQPWLTRVHSTTPSGSAGGSRPALPSPLQRELFRRVAQPVAVLTAHIPSASSLGLPTTGDRQDESHNHGATLSSLASISLSPPLVSFSLRLPSRLASFLSAAPDPHGPLGSEAPPPSFRVHLLSTKQEALARAFARQAPLPARAQPSPPPPSPSSTITTTSTSSADGTPEIPAPFSPAALPGFDPALFHELERTGLGSLDCRVVQRVPLASLGAASPDPETRQDSILAHEDQPRSELFIARVESVKLGPAKMEEGETALLYWDQQYAGAKALDSLDDAAYREE